MTRKEKTISAMTNWVCCFWIAPPSPRLRRDFARCCFGDSSQWRIYILRNKRHKKSGGFMSHFFVSCNLYRLSWIQLNN